MRSPPPKGLRLAVGGGHADRNPLRPADVQEELQIDIAAGGAERAEIVFEWERAVDGDLVEQTLCREPPNVDAEAQVVGFAWQQHRADGQPLAVLSALLLLVE